MNKYSIFFMVCVISSSMFCSSLEEPTAAVYRGTPAFKKVHQGMQVTISNTTCRSLSLCADLSDYDLPAGKTCMIEIPDACETVDIRSVCDLGHKNETITFKVHGTYLCSSFLPGEESVTLAEDEADGIALFKNGKKVCKMINANRSKELSAQEQYVPSYRELNMQDQYIVFHDNRPHVGQVFTE